jgi:CheY-like chemotaxis protein/HPt (histidine-containing phosphotransfer) domain-containing protein
LLLAEDNTVNQRVACLMVERMGFEIEVVGDGQAAVAAVATGRYDAVLMDCRMPIMDGFEATAAIRSMEADGRRIPIIALTGSALESDRRRCLAVGMDGHVAKPIQLDELAQALDQFVGAGPAAAPSAPRDQRPLLDPAVLGQIRELARDREPQLLRDLHARFARSAPELLRSMRAAAASGDLEALTTAAHTLKGSAGSLGATRLAELCGAIEQDAGRHQPADLERLLDDLQRHAAEVDAALAEAAAER